MDHELFDRRWHSPDYVQALQDLIKPDLELFEGQNFVEWSHKNGFEVSKIGLHPLEQAHAAAAALWQDRYASVLLK